MDTSCRGSVWLSLLDFYFKINYYEWGLIIFSIALVITTEMINTTMEYLVNLLKEERHEMGEGSRHQEISQRCSHRVTFFSKILALL